MRIGTLALVALPLALMASPVKAQPNEESDEDVYDDAAPGEPVANVDVFYDRLSDDGTWVDDPGIGHVFIPERTNYVPYHNGHWRRTSVGFVWDSDEPFAWATTHYGRWAWSRPYARWVWLPDTTWGPSWVEWRESGDHFGWAPLAPEIVIRAGYQTPVEYWHYCPGNRILDVNVVRYYEPRERIVTFHTAGRPIEHYARVSGARVVVGPPAVRLHAYGLVGAAYRPVRIETRLAGRMTPVESRAAVQRAHERHDMVETRNRQRIEANPHIREVHNAAVKAQPMHDPAHHTMEAHPGQPTHTPAHEMPPTHTAPAHQMPPTHTAPAHEMPPAHTAPAHEMPPAHAAPSHQMPPTHTAPAHEMPPTHTAPAHQAPPMTHQAPPPTHTAPSRQAPPVTHQAPPAPAHTAPAHQAPAQPAKKPTH